MRHHLGATLFAWLLLIPPSSYDPVRGAGRVFDTEKPLGEWIVAGTYDTEEECAAARDLNSAFMARQGNGDMAQRFGLGRCVAK